MIGQRFGELVVVAASGASWQCQCDCGALVVWPGSPLRMGRRKSCGSCVANRKKRGVARCSLCRSEKPLAQFHSRPDRPSGFLSECDDCRRARWNSNYRVDLLASRAKSRAKYSKDKRPVEIKEKAKTPAKHAAHQAVARALDAGTLVRPKECSVCGPSLHRIEAHHDDYSRPLDVQWLCASCHKHRHVELARSGKDPDWPGLAKREATFARVVGGSGKAGAS